MLHTDQLTAIFPEPSDGTYRKISMLNAALAPEGSIRNVEYTELRQWASRAIEEAWSKQVGAPFFHAGKYESVPEPIGSVYDCVSLYQLNLVPAAHKRISAIPTAWASHPAAQAMLRVATEAKQLSDHFQSIKDQSRIVMGRAPSTKPAEPPNPDKIVKTCACCFRPIAVTPHWNMVHHGYRRPGSGFQTASCPGVRFRPLEVSSEGLQHLIEATSTAIKSTEAELQMAKRPQGPNPMALGSKLVIIDGRRQLQPECTPDSPEWSRRVRAYTNALDRRLLLLADEQTALTKRLQQWQQIESLPPHLQPATREAESTAEEEEDAHQAPAP